MTSNTTEPRERWEFPAEAYVLSKPLLYDGTLYFGSGDSTLYAVAPEDGTERWRKNVEGSIVAELTVAEEMIYIGTCGSRGGLIHAIDRHDQSTHWHYSTDSDVMSKPVVANNRLIVPDVRECIYGLEVANGTLSWYIKNTTNTEMESTPAIWNDELVIAWGGMDILLGIDLESGQTVWTKLVGLEDSNLGSQLPSRDTSPVIHDDRVYVPSGNGELIGLDCTTGNREMSVKVGSQITTTPILKDEVAYVVTVEGSVIAVDLTTESIDWTESISDDEIEFSYSYESSFYGDVLYVVDANRLYAIDIDTGDQMWDFYVGGGPLTAPMVSGDMLYLACKPAGSVLAIERP